MKTFAALALLGAVTVGGPCTDIDEYPAAGYAVVTGALPPLLGYEVNSDVRVSCGLGDTSEWSMSADAYRPGRYRAELEWPHGDSELEMAGWTAVCHVASPAARPPYAEATGTVVFTPSRSGRETTTIDLVLVGD